MNTSSWNKGKHIMGDFFKKSSAPSVLNALKDIPDDLKYIFTPVSIEDLVQFEENVLNFAKRIKERDEVMRIQRKYNLRIRPNMSMRRAVIFIKLAELKNRKNNPPSSGYSDSNAK